MKTLLQLLAIASVAMGSATRAEDFPKGSPAFETKFSSAVKLAAANGKPVLAVFSAIWCAPCQQMKKEVYPAKAIQPFHDKFNWVYVDVDDASTEKLQQQFHIQYFPTIIFLNKDGKKVDEHVGGSDAKSFAEKLQSVLKKLPPAAEQDAPKKS
ncbi:MAG: thioredoxin family protein [Roseimicrobium sp.]